MVKADAAQKMRFQAAERDRINWRTEETKRECAAHVGSTQRAQSNDSVPQGDVPGVWGSVTERGRKCQVPSESDKWGDCSVAQSS